MSVLFEIRRFLAAATILLGLVATAPTVSAEQQSPQQPAQAQTPLIDPDALAVNQNKLLQENSRIQGFITIPDQKASVLVQPAGRTWDFYHEILLHWGGAIVILGAIALLGAFYFIVGRLPTRGARSHIRVTRFTSFERFSHWLTATSFVILALTGLNITFGKYLLRPLIGPSAFTTFSELSKYVHNYVGFAFIIGLSIIVTMWIRDNIPRKVDITWLKEGGGFIPGKHPTAGRFNAGEKMVFWFALGVGAAVAISGILLLFPFYVTNIFGMQIAQVVHSLLAVLFIAVILGHIYIGTLGMEGAFEAMGTGSVDYQWAKEHHGLWLEQEIAKGRVPPPKAAASPAE